MTEQPTAKLLPEKDLEWAIAVLADKYYEDGAQAVRIASEGTANHIAPTHRRPSPADFKLAMKILRTPSAIRDEDRARALEEYQRCELAPLHGEFSEHDVAGWFGRHHKTIYAALQAADAKERMKNKKTETIQKHT